jgi:hypothetical protein
LHATPSSSLRFSLHITDSQDTRAKKTTVTAERDELLGENAALRARVSEVEAHNRKLDAVFSAMVTQLNGFASSEEDDTSGGAAECDES